MSRSENASAETENATPEIPADDAETDVDVTSDDVTSDAGTPPEAPPKRSWLQPVLIGVFALVMLAVVAVTIYAVAQSHKAASQPLKLVGPISVKVTPGKSLGCDATIAFSATGSLSGSGTLTYQWERSDSAAPVVRQVKVKSEDSSFNTGTVYWSFTGTQHSSPTMTFHLLKPVDKKISTSFTENCG
jgi:hypothetical protein